jgi:hypothetical protein
MVLFGTWEQILADVAGVAGIAALIFSPSLAWRVRLLHPFYCLVVTIPVSAAVYNQMRLSKVASIERAARQLVESRRMEFSHAGFIQAALSFLEKNKLEFPDTYSRAQELCRLNSCLGSENSAQGGDSLKFAFDQIRVASALEGALRGIAKISGEQ